MKTRTSRSVPGVLLTETLQSDEVQEGSYLAEFYQLLEAYLQHAQSSSDSFGTFVHQIDEFESSSNGKKTSDRGDDGDGGAPLNDIYINMGEDPEPDMGPMLTVSNPQKIEGDEGNNILEGSAVDNEIYGYGGNDTIYGYAGIDTLRGGDGHDNIFGGDDRDFLLGGAGDDNLHGEEGDDDLKGGSGNDNIFGGPGDDYIQGDEGNDIAFGDEGDDTFMDNGGSDTYTGGEGADHFIFLEGNFWAGAGGGYDLILDFELGVDKLKIWQWPVGEFGGLTFNEYMDQFASGGGEAGVVIEWANGLIRLAGVDKEDLNPWDIELVL